eukprot:c2333_g1_i1.p3 GENE.c2333_g1_i1~~c2333_g1_i1.p3  ORF type:complete len:181 (+),score=36.19 c2333_g1_i1:25-543(+)
MKAAVALTLALFAIGLLCAVRAEETAAPAAEGTADISHGWGEAIDWVSLDEARKLAPLDSKIIMAVIHKSWCGACRALRPKFAESEEIRKLSEHFVMVNLADDDEPKGEEFAPDGGYIPRILFLSPDGTVQPQVVNAAANPKYKYYYPTAESIAVTMKSLVDHGIPKPKVEL